MKKSFKKIARIAMLAVCISMIASCLVACPPPPDGPNYDSLVKLTIDAGGQNAQYNSRHLWNMTNFLTHTPIIHLKSSLMNGMRLTQKNTDIILWLPTTPLTWTEKPWLPCLRTALLPRFFTTSVQLSQRIRTRVGSTILQT